MNAAARKKIHIIITVLIMAFIFFQSSLPADISSQESGLLTPFVAETFKLDMETASMTVRKSAHFLEYLVLGIFMSLTVRDFINKSVILVKKGKPVWYLISWSVCAVYCITDEIHQALVPGRSCEVRDMLIDCCGAAIGAAIMIVPALKRNLTA